MLDGTKKLFPNEYGKFKDAMMEAAREQRLPQAMKLDDIADYTLADLQDAFCEFNRDTGLELLGTMEYCSKCRKLHLYIQVNYPELDNEEEILPQ